MRDIHGVKMKDPQMFAAEMARQKNQMVDHTHSVRLNVLQGGYSRREDGNAQARQQGDRAEFAVNEGAEKLPIRHFLAKSRLIAF